MLSSLKKPWDALSRVVVMSQHMALFIFLISTTVNLQSWRIFRLSFRHVLLSSLFHLNSFCLTKAIPDNAVLAFVTFHPFVEAATMRLLFCHWRISYCHSN